MNFKTPILVITYNKPEALSMILTEIKKIKPTSLYIASDQSSSSEDKKDVLAVRNLIKNISIPNCKIKIKLQKNNLGCKEGVVDAIDWFFNNVEEGIILEEDCKPNYSFFYFCANLLKKYRKNKKVYQISGSNPFYYNPDLKSDYFFSKYIRIWGWATWKNRWQDYDKDILSWPDIKKSRKHFAFFDTKKEAIYWEKIWDSCYNKTIDTWDYQFFLAKLLKRGLTIIPNKNLISNIGFSAKATHTKIDINGIANYPTQEINFPLKHPTSIQINVEHDRLYRSAILKPRIFQLINSLLKKCMMKLQKT